MALFLLDVFVGFSANTARFSKPYKLIQESQQSDQYIVTISGLRSTKKEHWRERRREAEEEEEEEGSWNVVWCQARATFKRFIDEIDFLSFCLVELVWGGVRVIYDLTLPLISLYCLFCFLFYLC